MHFKNIGNKWIESKTALDFTFNFKGDQKIAVCENLEKKNPKTEIKWPNVQSTGQIYYELEEKIWVIFSDDMLVLSHWFLGIYDFTVLYDTTY